MERRPRFANTLNSIRMHFSRRTSAGRVALRKFQPGKPLAPLADLPDAVYAAAPYHRQLSNR
jgi:hypothetical protein